MTRLARSKLTVIALAFSGLSQLPGCGAGSTPASDAASIIADYAEQAAWSNDIYFAVATLQQFDEMIAELEDAGFTVDDNQNNVFVPPLAHFPGFFDFGLAMRWSANSKSLSMNDGRVRIFRDEVDSEGLASSALVIVISEHMYDRSIFARPTRETYPTTGHSED